MIVALVTKDFKLYFRNQFFAVITVLALLAFAALYYIMPADVDQTLDLAVYAEDTALVEQVFGAGLEAKTFDSADDLREAVDDGDYPAGIVLTSDALTAISAGEPTTLTTYYMPGIGGELRAAYNDVLTLSVNSLRTDAGQMISVVPQEEVLGKDLSAPIAARERLLPTLVLFALLTETMGLATLVTEEIEHDTATAVLTTPLSLSQFFASKTIVGMGLAFGQTLLLVVLTTVFFEAPLIIIVTLALGSMLVTGFGFLIASVARDMMGVMAWGMLILLGLSLPSIALMFPGLANDWTSALPSYYIADTLHQAANYDAGWGDVADNLLILAASSALSLGLGSLILRRRFQ